MGTTNRQPGAESDGDAAGADPDAAAVFDRAALIADLGDAAFVEELISNFRNALPARVAKLAAALQQSDFDTLRFEAHALKSSAGNLRAMALFRHAGELEAAAEAGHRDAAEAGLRAIRAIADDADTDADVQHRP